MKAKKVDDTSTHVFATVCVMGVGALAVIALFAGIGELDKAKDTPLALAAAKEQLGWMLIAAAISLVLVTMPVMLLLTGIYREVMLARMILQHDRGVDIYGVEGLEEAASDAPAQAPADTSG